MRNKISLIGLIGLLVLILNSCYYDEVATIEGIPSNVSLKNDIQPIFNQNCNTTGCHDAVPAHNPSLVTGSTYNALINGNYVNTLDPEKSKIYQEIVTGSMPPSGALSINDQKLILGWITDGAKDN